MQHIKQSSIGLTVIASVLLLSPIASFADTEQTTTATTTTTTAATGATKTTTTTSVKARYAHRIETVPVPCPPPLILKDGFYMGIKALYDSYAIRINPKINNPGGSALAIAMTNPSLANGWGGGVFGGYGHYFSNMFYMGAEIFVNYSAALQPNSFTISTAFNTSSMGGQISAAMSWGISILPGYKFSDSTLGYIRLGYEQVQLKGTQNFSTTLGGGLSSSAYVNAWQGGFNYGIGIETALIENVSLRGEADHMHNNTFNNQISRYKPSNNQYSLGLVYHFG